jgi:hypothetical protein
VLRIVSVLSVVLAFAMVILGLACGPQKQFCPPTGSGGHRGDVNGNCIGPAVDSGSESTFIDTDGGGGDSIFIGGDM